MPERRAGRPRGLVEVDDPFLGGDEHRNRGRELGDRGPGESALDIAVRRLHSTGHGHRHVLTRPPVDLAERIHGGETTHMGRQLITSGAAFEQRVGYSRAVRVGDRVWVSGTAPIMPDDADPPDTPYDQAKVCLAIIGRALQEAGSSLDDVVRSRIYVTDAAFIDDVG